MADKVVAHPLITIANIIWSFNPLTHLPQVLLVKRLIRHLRATGLYQKPYCGGMKVLTLPVSA